MKVFFFRISIESLTTRKTVLRYIHMIHICVFVGIYILYYEVFSSVTTSMSPQGSVSYVSSYYYYYYSVVNVEQPL